MAPRLQNPFALTVILLIFFALLAPVFAETTSYEKELLEIQELLEEGEDKQAFLRLSQLRGGGAWAVMIAKNDPEVYLQALEGLQGPEVALIRADLSLARKNPSGALQIFREVARTTRGSGYPVSGENLPSYFLLEPFTVGPGSYRDNWLIRRLMGLGALEEAEREYARIWSLHKKRRQSQFDGLGLQFVIDYSKFLSERGKGELADSVLLEALSTLNLDRSIDMERQHKVGWLFPGSSFRPGVGRREFLKQALDQLGSQAIAKVRAEGVGLRTLAELQSLSGNSEQALSLELRYIESLDTNNFSKHFRRGLIYQTHGHPKLAKSEFTKASELYSSVLKQKVNLPDPEIDQMLFHSLGNYARWAMEGDELPNHDLKCHLGDRILSLEERPSPETIFERSLLSFAGGEPTYFHTKDYSLRNLEASAHSLKREKEFFEWMKSTAENEESLPAARASLYKRLNDNTNYQKFGVLAAEDFIQKLEAKPPNRRDKEQLTRAKIQALRLRGDGWSEPCKRLAYDANPTPESATALLHYYGETKRRHSFDELTAEVLKRDGPLKQYWESYKGEEGRPGGSSSYQEDRGNGLLATLICYGSKKTLAQVKQFCSNYPASPASRQLARLNTPKQPVAALLNQPANCAIVAPSGHVTGLVADDNYLYLGTSWGVDVFTLEGERVGKVALGGKTQDMVVHKGILWVACSSGLARVEPVSWRVKHNKLNQYERARRSGTSQEKEEPRAESVESLGICGENLWMKNGSKLYRLDLTQDKLTCYRSSDFPGEKHPLFQDGKHLWLGHLRMALTDDSYDEILFDGKPVLPFAVVDGKIWGMVKNERTPIVVIVEPDGLSVSPVDMLGDRRDLRSLQHIGHWKGFSIFGDGHRFWRYEDGQLKRILGLSLRRSRAISELDGFVLAKRKLTVPLPDGRIAFLRYGRLHIAQPDPQSEKNSLARTDGLPEGQYKSLLSDGKTTWIQASDGLVEMSEGGRTLAYTSADGIPNSLTGMLKLKERLYFASGSRVVIFHLENRIFTLHTLPGIHGTIRSLQEQNGRIRLTYQRDSKGPIRVISVDPLSLEWELQPDDPEEPEERRWSPKKMPILGLSSPKPKSLDSKEFHLGHGVVVHPRSWTPRPHELALDIEFSSQLQATLKKRNRRIEVKTVEDLENYLDTSDPSVRRRAISAVPYLRLADFLPSLSRAVNDLDTGVRFNLVKEVGRSTAAQATSILNELAQDKDRRVKAFANYELFVRGLPADFESIIAYAQGGSSLGEREELGLLVKHKDLSRTIPILIALHPEADEIRQSLATRLQTEPGLVYLFFSFHRPLEREFAFDVLHRAGEQLLPELSKHFDSDNLAHRIRSAEIATYLGSEEGEEILLGLLSSADFATQGQVLKALRHSGSSLSVPTLIQRYHSVKARGHALRVEKTEPSKKGEQLLDGLGVAKSRDSVWRTTREPSARDFLGAILSIGTSECQPFLRQLLTSESGEFREVGIVSVLGEAEDEQVAPNLKLLHELEKDPELKVAASFAMHRLDSKIGRERIEELLNSDKPSLIKKAVKAFEEETDSIQDLLRASLEKTTSINDLSFPERNYREMSELEKTLCGTWDQYGDHGGELHFVGRAKLGIEDGKFVTHPVTAKEQIAGIPASDTYAHRYDGINWHFVEKWGQFGPGHFRLKRQDNGDFEGYYFVVGGNKQRVVLRRVGSPTSQTPKP